MKLILGILLLTGTAFAAFAPIPGNPPTDAIQTTGGLLTSNGTTQVEALACQNGEIIEYDSAEAYGFKCVVKPVIPAVVSTYEFIGRATWDMFNAGNRCQWRATSAGTWIDAASINGAACVSATTIGANLAANGNAPSVQILNARTDGYYKLTFYTNVEGNCLYGMFSDSQRFGVRGTLPDSDAYAGQYLGESITFQGIIKYTTGGTKIVTIQGKNVQAPTSEACNFFGSTQGGDTALIDSELPVRMFVEFIGETAI
jgi:hypothetical protein